MNAGESTTIEWSISAASLSTLVRAVDSSETALRAAWDVLKRDLHRRGAIILAECTGELETIRDGTLYYGWLIHGGMDD